MRAHVLTKFGKSNDVLELREQPCAVPGPGQVCVRTRAAAINAVDIKTREGEPKMILPFSPPFVLGVDLAGTVSEIGEGVTSVGVGDTVYSYTGMDRMGAFQECVVLDEARLARAPGSMSPQRAACLPLPGLCALQALDAGKVGRGSRVLIHAGAGAVGSLAVQLAKARGAEVCVTVSAADIERTSELGADTVINYRAERFEQRAKNMDFVFDTVGGDTLKRSWGTVKPGGTLATLHVPPDASVLVRSGLRANALTRLVLPLATRRARADAARAGGRLVRQLTVPDAERLAQLATMVDAGQLRTSIDHSFTFDDLGAALDHAASGQARGRVVLQCE